MERYKSWSDLQKLLNERLCDELRGRITYFLTRYHDVHNAYGRAAIRLDRKELVCFSWIEQYRQEDDASVTYRVNSVSAWEEIQKGMKPKWDAVCTYCEMDFLNAVLQFRSMPIQTALQSDDCIIRILTILDRRVGVRTLKRIVAEKEYESYPEWVRQFYELRLSVLSCQKAGQPVFE
ncbi:MAG: hypothetical protein ABFC31_10930 [Clostridiaceae bacterium]